MQLYYYVFLLILLDAAGLACAKQWYLTQNKFYILAGMLAFAFIPLIFAFTTKYASSGVANATWAGFSAIVITVTGILIFKENISTWQIVGILTIVLGLFLMEVK